jgi:hypothetical protein
MPAPRIDDSVGAASVRAALAGLRIADLEDDGPIRDVRAGDDGSRQTVDIRIDADRQTVATATRFLLQRLTDRAPGHSVEVRVPPFGAVQCVEGPRHTRGTPPNVIEMRPAVWLALAGGRVSWGEAVEAGIVQASGARADLSVLLPLRV